MACGKGRSFSPAAPLAGMADQTVAVEHRMYCTLGRDAHLAGELADQQFPDLPGAPMRLLALELDDQALDLVGQLVGVAHRPPRAVTQCVQPLLPYSG